MASYTRAEVTRTRVEYSVPAGDGYWNDLCAAIAAVEKELVGRSQFDNAVRLEARDDHVVLSYEKVEVPF